MEKVAEGRYGLLISKVGYTAGGGGGGVGLQYNSYNSSRGSSPASSRFNIMLFFTINFSAAVGM